MTSFLVSCEGARTPKKRSSRFDKKVDVALYGSSPTGRLEITNVTNAIVHSLDPLNRDLLEIAAYVYLADTESPRGSDRDVLNERWVRDFEMAIPVRRPDFWTRPAVSRQLARVLSIASGDKWTFRFIKGREKGEQLFVDLSETAFPGADCVCLFSGGADSLTGVLHATEDLNKHPLLLSHRSSTRIDSRQEALLKALNARRHGKRPLSQVSVWIHRRRTQAKEPTQRTRGFLFLSLASSLALELGLDTVLVPENGPVSVNIRKLQQSYSTTLSRTTHPALISEFQKLLHIISPKKAPRLVNPFIFETKREVLERLKKYDAESLLQETVSCAHIQGKAKTHPHCGVCSQCIDRRFAAVVAELEPHDLPGRYEKDVFVDALPDGAPRMQAEAHIRLALRLNDLSPEAISEELSELATAAAALPGPAAANAEQLEAMMRRYAADIESCIKTKTNQHFAELLRGKLPQSCLLRLTVGLEHLKQIPQKTALAIGEVLAIGWPKVFASVPAKNEHHVQDATEALLESDLQTWTREGPLLPYSIVKTKPDFSSGEQFFVEIKYPREAKRLNAIVTEITSRITVYRQQGASALFAVWDPTRAIKDDVAFAHDFEQHSGIFVRVVR